MDTCGICGNNQLINDSCGRCGAEWDGNGWSYDANVEERIEDSDRHQGQQGYEWDPQDGQYRR